jgi:hypothetical protein
MPSAESAYPSLFRYAESFVGIPYRWFRPTDTIEAEDKTFAVNGPPPDLFDVLVRDKSMVCVGLTNVMRRYMELEIPYDQNRKYPGTTSAYTEYFWDVRFVLRNQHEIVSLPKGTLLMWDWESWTNQGHVAVKWDHDTVLHAVPTMDDTDDVKDHGCVQTQCLSDLHDTDFTHAVLPEHWLKTNRAQLEQGTL